jgi:chromosome segregation ATPase
MKRRERLVLGLVAVAGLTWAGGSSPAPPPGGYQPFRPPDPNAWEHLEGEERTQAMERELDRAFPGRAWARQQMEEMQQRMQEQMKQGQAQAREQADRESLGATDAQWRMIQPRLQALRDLNGQASAFILLQRRFLQGGTRRVNGVEQKKEPACQWQWERPWADKARPQLHPAERTCEELFDLLSDEQTPVETIRDKVELLRRQKKEAAAQVPAAREALRQVLDVRQQAVLTVQGLLK